MIKEQINRKSEAITEHSLYFFPLDTKNKQRFENAYALMTHHLNDNTLENTAILVNGRAINIVQAKGDVIQFDFSQLCNTNRSVHDYIEIARSYNNIFIDNVCQFNDTNDDQARRFINLIDIFYEFKIKLIICSQVPLHDLYLNGNLGEEFKRTKSRLTQMQAQNFTDS